MRSRYPVQMTAALDVCAAPRPSWRGRMHSWAFAAAIPAGVLLVVAADGTVATTAAVLYVLSLLAVFGTSASYHRLAHGERARRIMQRLDHSMIYLLILGSYVPLCLVALPAAWGIPVLAVVGALAVVGMVLKLVAFDRTPKFAGALYPVMGWVAIVAAPALVDHLTATQLALVVGGGLAYTLGIPVLFRRRPDPWPTTFGYHEVWHSFTVVAAVLHFVAIADVVT